MSEVQAILTSDDLLVDEYSAAIGKEELPLCYVDSLAETQTLRSLLAAVELEIRAHGPDAVVAFDSGYNNISVSLTEASVIREATERLSQKRLKAGADAVARKRAKLKAQLKELDSNELKALITSLEN